MNTDSAQTLWHAFSRKWTRASVLVLGIIVTVFLAACESDDDDYDHTPPPGWGSLIVDNRTPGDVYVWIDSVEQPKVDDDEWNAFDLQPGIYRVVIKERSGDRSWYGDVDILDDRLTIVRVNMNSFDPYRYDVFIWFD